MVKKSLFAPFTDIIPTTLRFQKLSNLTNSTKFCKTHFPLFLQLKKFILVTISILMFSNMIPPPRQLQYLQGSVQRKLRWVKNGVNRSVGASDCGAGHSFVMLFGSHLGFAIFPFPVSTAQSIGELWNNGWSGASDIAPLVLALYSCHR